ncbi:MAG: bifunctional diaminohydroxyphosphoribosylaminopyrimidine deaminase/5-amino-6-(5-phosphoribosylamino)uracil reductase RibD [Acidobacteria bacterium]|nr:bifunctional diaminohydroxyphosphoribosylaminopyrimidine deaminase/5-amino-6-(5-phosphoribosylamino)uracil reductase RibD [Acidobacteriota bacterium]
MMFSAQEQRAMEAALVAARRGIRGANPLVGAVVIAESGEVLATGYHRGAGTPHAEAAALAQLGTLGPGELAQATMVVTLEPCNHQGRTGPCAQAIINAGIGNVIYAIDDPHADDVAEPAGGGAATLRAANVAVRSGLLADQAYELNARWFAAVAERRPFITLHIAQTLDGKIAAEDGTSQWISGPESLAHNHGLRRRIDAILVGTETVLVDNPRLTARNPHGSLAAVQPLRVVLGERAIPERAAVRGSDGRFVQLATHDVVAAARTLHDLGVRHLLVEGGARVASAFLAADQVDHIIVYLAPIILGTGLPSLTDLGITTLRNAAHWSFDSTGDGAATVLGSDLKLQLIPAALAATAHQPTAY